VRPTYPATGTAWSARPGTYSFTPAAREDSQVPRGSGIPSAGGEGDERTRILGALERCGGNQTHAARLLGMSRRTLINRIERYNLPRPRKRDES
jgi:transcriptional regulator with GAF, ATPase, and Fis domain